MIQATITSSTLAQRLCERIRREGPITFRNWMDAALYDEQEGYYRRNGRRRWGRGGDYRTSPERSTLFAATFASYFAKLYRELNSPATWTIVEVGAGDGRFARGVLETFRDRFPQVFAATKFVIDETGADASLRNHLDAFTDRVQFKSLTDSDPINPGIIFSNELLDAFPIHRVTRANGQLRELHVTVAGDEKFEWTTGPLSNPALEDYFTASAIELEEGQIADVNLDIKRWLQQVADKLARGYLVTVDYGADANALFNSSVRPNGTLRGFYRHELLDDPLARPGEQDLTSTVDWTFVKRVGVTLGLEVLKFERQDKFLLQEGLLEELELQARLAGSDAERLALSTAAREMILPNGMAASFQVLVQEKGQQGR
jgi:SAM-dependent MidA family methyltransferase